jgi:ABC-type uncharacterized transport system permease subunit
MDWSLLLLRAALLLYLLGFVNALVPLLLGSRRTVRATPWLAAGGALAHTAGLVANGLALGRCPLATLPEVLSALAWAAVLIYLVTWWRSGLEVLHPIILPLVLVVLCISNLLPEGVVPVSDTLRPAVLRFHLTAIVLGVGALFVTFAASLLYVVVDRLLKAKRPPRAALRLPSLEICDSVGRVSLLWAFPLLTFGIVSGALVSAGLGRPFWNWEPRETLAILAWVILGVVVVARLGWGWRGRNAALLTIVGFAAVLLRMLGVY